jgi:hypothetical protein
VYDGNLKKNVQSIECLMGMHTSLFIPHHVSIPLGILIKGIRDPYFSLLPYHDPFWFLVSLPCTYIGPSSL